jgi:lantibiotic modifying enzyme
MFAHGSDGQRGRAARTVGDVLFDPRVHEPLTDVPWAPEAVRAAVGDIARGADDALREKNWWPWHPLDSDGETPEAVHGVYLGAAGVLLALQRLADAGLHEPGHDYARLATEALEGYRERPEFGGPAPSMWMGESGIALVAWLLSPSDELANRLAQLVVVDPEHDTLELMWGSPGLLLVADAMLERTGEERWASAWRALAEHLLGRWGDQAPRVWTQRVHGSVSRYLGPAHGFAGVVAALARRPELLPADRLGPGATATLAATAVREGRLANWPPALGGPLQDPRGIRTQWCHGAPGMVASLAALRRDDALDALLLAGGELTYAAGPLRKGANLCHGTAGNGFALLKLFTRTGDELWLERARRFAVHAAGQVAVARQRHGRGRYTLWTGDPGAARYLQACLAGSSDLPTIDEW